MRTYTPSLLFELHCSLARHVCLPDGAAAAGDSAAIVDPNLGLLFRENCSLLTLLLHWSAMSHAETKKERGERISPKRTQKQAVSQCVCAHAHVYVSTYVHTSA